MAYASFSSPSAIDAAAFNKQVQQDLDYSGGIRKGRIDCLPQGASASYDMENPCIVSTSDGVRYMKPGRVDVTTSIISLKMPIPYNAMYYRNMSEKFVAHETKTVMDMFARHADSILYENKEDVNRLQKWFNDLGKPVVVLSKDQILDINSKAFTLVIRQNLSTEVFDNVSKLCSEFVLWEDVGFIYELKETV